MKTYQEAFIALAFIVFYGSADVPCLQSLELRNKGNSVLQKRLCHQTVEQHLLQGEPEIYYHEFLPSDHAYTLLFLENNTNNAHSRPMTYKVHWLLTNIIPVNDSLTASKTTIVGYIPPNNVNASDYVIQLYKQPLRFMLQNPLGLELNEFVPNKWVEPYQDVVLVNEVTFNVTGRNPAETFATNSTQMPPSSYTNVQFQSSPETVSSLPATIGPDTNTQTIINETRPGYHFYNATAIKTTTQLPTISQKNGASKPSYNHLMVTLLPIIYIATNMLI